MLPTVVITGSASGIGEACYKALEDSIEFTPFGIDAKASSRTDLVINLDSKVEIDEAISSINQRFRKLAGLVNCAGVQIKKPLDELTHEDWLECITINAIAPFFLLGRLLPLLNNGGAVVNIGSVHSTATSIGMSAYAASKGALASGTRAAALELAQYGIRVNCVSPGAIDTAMLKEGLSNSRPIGGVEALGKLEESVPMGRIGSPGDVAQLVLFLLSEKSRYITGGEFFVDGGVIAALASEATRHEPRDIP